MFDFWFELPTLLRIGLGLLILAISTAVLLFAGRIWIWGFAVGGIMILASGAGNNKGGYNF